MNAKCIVIISSIAIVLSQSEAGPVKKTKTTGKKPNLFGEFALVEYLFKLGDVNKDKALDKNEIYNFYRHFIGFSRDKAAKMSIQLINLGDLDKDQKLGEIEAVLALGKVTNRITKT